MTNSNSTIRVENVSKRYGKIEALNDVSLHVEHGAILGMLGPNVSTGQPERTGDEVSSSQSSKLRVQTISGQRTPPHFGRFSWQSSEGTDLGHSLLP